MPKSRPEFFTYDLAPKDQAVYNFLRSNRDLLTMAGTLLRWGGSELLVATLHGVSKGQADDDYLAWAAYEANAHHTADSMAKLVREMELANERSIEHWNKTQAEKEVLPAFDSTGQPRGTTVIGGRRDATVAEGMAIAPGSVAVGNDSTPEERRAASECWRGEIGLGQGPGGSADPNPGREEKDACDGDTTAGSSGPYNAAVRAARTT